MNWTTLLSKRRLGEGGERPAEDGRSEFQKDYDRIIFSHAFRRLQGKTQVHPLPENDHIHTRLTHTLEVASVGRSLGERVGLTLENRRRLPDGMRPQDIGSIVQAACLAHDIGNPPFGHGGEFAIRAWFSEHHEYLSEVTDKVQRLDLEGYEGNAQGLRILSQLEGQSFGGGLRLTFATLGAFMKYPWSSGHAVNIGKNKFGFFQTEKHHMEKIAFELGLVARGVGAWVRHPLAYLVEAADDICYSIMDLEDAIEVGILDIGQLKSIFEEALSYSDHAEYSDIPENDPSRRVAFLRGKAIDYLVRDVVSVFEKQEEALLAGEFEGELLRDGSHEIIEKAKQLALKKCFRIRIKPK